MVGFPQFLADQMQQMDRKRRVLHYVKTQLNRGKQIAKDTAFKGTTLFKAAGAKVQTAVRPVSKTHDLLRRLDKDLGKQAPNKFRYPELPKGRSDHER